MLRREIDAREGRRHKICGAELLENLLQTLNFRIGRAAAVPEIFVFPTLLFVSIVHIYLTFQFSLRAAFRDSHCASFSLS